LAGQRKPKFEAPKGKTKQEPNKGPHPFPRENIMGTPKKNKGVKPQIPNGKFQKKKIGLKTENPGDLPDI